MSKLSEEDFEEMLLVVDILSFVRWKLMFKESSEEKSILFSPDLSFVLSRSCAISRNIIEIVSMKSLSLIWKFNVCKTSRLWESSAKNNRYSVDVLCKIFESPSKDCSLQIVYYMDEKLKIDHEINFWKSIFVNLIYDGKYWGFAFFKIRISTIFTKYKL